jgi:hypothetical protein
LLVGCGSDHATAPVPAGTPTEAGPPPPAQTATQATPTATPTNLRKKHEPDAGDEKPIGVPVRVLVTPTRIRVVGGATVPAFLPLRVTVTSRLPDAIEIHVIAAGGDGTVLGAGRVRGGGRVAFRVPGAQPGSLEILSPDLNPDRTAFVTVKRSG